MPDLQLQISDLCFLPRARAVACCALSDALLGEGRDGKEARACVSGTCSVLLCHELPHRENMRYSAKAETLRRETIGTITPAKAVAGACLESVSTMGRKGLPCVYTNAERPLQGGKALRDRLCSWTGGRDGYGPLHICASCFPKRRSLTQTSANMSAGTASPRGANMAQSWMLTVTQKPPKSQTRPLLQCFLKTPTSISEAHCSLKPGGLGFLLPFA